MCGEELISELKCGIIFQSCSLTCYEGQGADPLAFSSQSDSKP